VGAEPRRVALVKLSSLGDVVHALPVAAALHARFPEAAITWLAEPREAALLRRHPALARVIEVPTRAWRRARRPGALADVARALGRLRAALAAGAFDTALDLGGLVKTGLLTAATRAPVRVGFAARSCREPLSAMFTNRRVTPPPSAGHVVEQYLALLGPLGIEAPAVEFALPAPPAAAERMARALAAADVKPGDRVVALIVGAARPDKRWLPERFAVVATAVAAEAAARVLVLWGPGEEAEARAVVAAAEGAATLAPPTDLDELTALLRRASVVVGGDTGPLHVAAALGVPCVGLYGPTAAVRNGPYGAVHRALQSPDGTLAGLDSAPVARAVLEALG
jgi:heptosyltransferase-1